MDKDGNLEASDLSAEAYRSQGPKTPEEALLIARIVWGALLVSQGMYLYVGRILLNGQASAVVTMTGEPPGLVASLTNPQSLPLIIAAFMALAMSFIFPKMLAGQRAVKPQAGPSANPIAAPRDRLRIRLMQFIVGLALNESAALIGLAGGFVALKNPELGSLIIYVSIAAMLTRFPSGEKFSV
ncbi:hypothetical protein BH10BDE1_BH10BDE1_15170 [soil metagenome]